MFHGTAIHRARRQRILDRLGDGLLLLPTAPEQIRNGDVHHDFRPGSDFHYLTGFDEPEAVLVAWRTPRSGRRRAGHQSVLFVRPRNREREIWDGRRAGVAGARRRFGVDGARSVAELFDALPDLLGDHPRLFHRLGQNRAFDQRLMRALGEHAARRRRANAPAHPTITDPLPVIAAERLVKGPEELVALEEAARITAAGHCAAMRAARPGMTEYQLQAEVEAAFRREGAARTGYGSIVASGANACILHYVENRRTMRAGDLLLLDAGAEYGMYTADITRTFPVSGSFSEPQKRVYGWVLRAQRAAIAAVKPGAAWDAPHKAAVRVLTRGLVDLGVLRGDPRALVAKAAYRPYYMHGTSHWLGLDVHDAGPYQDAAGKPVRLRPGMVLTVEPGLYFGSRDRRLPKALRGIGVRIEDDVLVARGGRRVLTAGVPKELAEVEALCRVRDRG